MQFWCVAFADWMPFFRNHTFIQTLAYCSARFKVKTGYKTLVVFWTWYFCTLFRPRSPPLPRTYGLDLGLSLTPLASRSMASLTSLNNTCAILSSVKTLIILCHARDKHQHVCGSAKRGLETAQKFALAVYGQPLIPTTVMPPATLQTVMLWPWTWPHYVRNYTAINVSKSIKNYQKHITINIIIHTKNGIMFSSHLILHDCTLC